MESNTSFRFLVGSFSPLLSVWEEFEGLAQTKTVQSKPTAKEQVLKQHPPSKAWIKDRKHRHAHAGTWTTWNAAPPPSVPGLVAQKRTLRKN